MTKVRDATAYLRDRTIDGMNSGADLRTFMRDITLPSAWRCPRCTVKLPGSSGPSGRSTSAGSVTNRPPSCTTRPRRRSGRCRRAGGRYRRAHRASRSPLRSWRPLQALHLTDIVLSHSPDDTDAKGVKRRRAGTTASRQRAREPQRSPVAGAEINAAKVEETSEGRIPVSHRHSRRRSRSHHGVTAKAGAATPGPTSSRSIRKRSHPTVK